MSTQNFFALLGDDENEEPTAVITRASLPLPGEKPAPTKKSQQQEQPVVSPAPARLPTKPLPPAEAVKAERAQLDGSRGGGRGGRGRGRSYDRERDGGAPRELGFPSREGRDGYNRDRDRGSNYNNDRSSGNREVSDGFQGNRPQYGGGSGGYNERAAPRGEDGERSSEGSRGRGNRGRGGRDRGFGGDSDERPRRRDLDRQSGSGHRNELKRDGSGRGNWGAAGDQGPLQDFEAPAKEDEKVVTEHEDKKVEGENNVEAVVVEDGAVEKKEEEEDNEMTLEEYEKILDEKRKALAANKSEERKVEADKAFETMQLVDKKNDEDVFIKLGVEKDKGKKKEALEKEEKARKSVSINEFLKPADGEKYYGSAGTRGRGRGRGGAAGGGGDRGGYRGGFAGGFNNARRVSAPRIEDPGQFPTLGGVHADA